jgi:O-antigen/teichoic acid export membrane protein
LWAVVSQFTGYLWLMDFGVRGSVIKYVAEYHEKKDFETLNNIINASLKLYSAICLACLAVTCLLAALFPYIFTKAADVTTIARMLVIITGVDIAQSFVFNVFIGIVMGLQRYDVFSKVSVVLTIVRGLLTLLFLSMGYGVVSVCLIQLLANTCMNLVIYAVSRRLLSFKLNFLKFGKGRSIYRLIINYSYFVFLNCLAAQIFSFSSNFIIAFFLPVSAVTFYTIAASLIEYMKKVIIAGTQAFGPMTSQLDAKNDSSMITTLLFNGSKISLLLGLPVGIVYLVLGKQFIRLWMGFEYGDSTGNILAVLTVMTLFSLPHYTISSILLGLNKHHLTAYCRLAEAIVNICLSVILTRHMGILGTALGVAIPHLIMVIFILPVLVTKIMRVRLSDYLRHSYYGPLISALPFALACFLVGTFFSPNSLLTFFVEVMVLLPVYIVTAWFFAISKEDRQLCKKTIYALAPSALGR